MDDRKVHKPVLDHNGNPFSPAQILALERAELTRVRVMRDTMLLAEQRDQLIQTDVVQRQAAAIFTACRQKLLLIPHTLARRLVGKCKDARAIHDALTKEIHKALREMADFHQKIINSGLEPGGWSRPTAAYRYRPTTEPEITRSIEIKKPTQTLKKTSPLKL